MRMKRVLILIIIILSNSLFNIYGLNYYTYIEIKGSYNGIYIDIEEKIDIIDVSSVELAIKEILTDKYGSEGLELFDFLLNDNNWTMEVISFNEEVSKILMVESSDKHIKDIENEIKEVIKDINNGIYDLDKIKNIEEILLNNECIKKDNETIKDFLQITSELSSNKIYFLNNDINNLPDNYESISNKEKVLKLWESYNDLDEIDKSSIENFNKLEYLYGEYKKDINNRIASHLIAEIDKLKDIDDLEFKDSWNIRRLSKKYKELDDESKKKVYNLSKLQKSNRKIDSILEQMIIFNKAVSRNLRPKDIDHNSTKAIKNVDDAKVGLSDEDLSYMTSYKKYYIPAKIQYIDSLILEYLVENDSNIVINKDNYISIKDKLLEIEKQCLSIPKLKRKHIKNYKIYQDVKEELSIYENTNILEDNKKEIKTIFKSSKGIKELEDEINKMNGVITRKKLNKLKSKRDKEVRNNKKSCKDNNLVNNKNDFEEKIIRDGDKNIEVEKDDAILNESNNSKQSFIGVLIGVIILFLNKK